ncbi:hypothetical protein [Streptomyces sp. NPDC059783]|uniref:hypothetical protein n=1 Tax=Streptomyces sp. NPDC059783 TaxID=3346944 RepID=UPI003653CB7F
MRKSVKTVLGLTTGALALTCLTAAPAAASSTTYFSGPTGCSGVKRYDYSVAKYIWDAGCSGRSSKYWRVTVTFQYTNSPGAVTNYTLPWHNMGTPEYGESSTAYVVGMYNWQFK